jgi:tetratricopeptide (TPR) repeat protein
LSNGSRRSLYRVREYDQALDYYEQAIALFQALSIPKMEALARQGLGQVWYELGEYDQAIDQYQQALAIDQRIADLEGEAYALVNMGETQTTLENYPQALQTYQQALLIFNESGIVSGQSRTLGNIGNVLATQGQPELAIAFLKAAVESREFIRSNLQGLPVEIQQSYTEKNCRRLSTAGRSALAAGPHCRSPAGLRSAESAGT